MVERFWAAGGRVGNKATAPSTPHLYIVRGARVTNGSIAPAFIFLSRRWLIFTLVTLSFITALGEFIHVTRSFIITALGDFLHSLHGLSSRRWVISYTRYTIFHHGAG